MRNLIIFFIAFSPVLLIAQMTEREQQVLDEINLVRTNPKSYIPYIDVYLDSMDSDVSERSAANELKNELNKMVALSPLVFSKDLYKSCKSHGTYVSKTKKFVHSKGNYAENIQYGHSDVRNAIIDLLIDDGVPSRGHRKNILNSRYKHFAVYEIEPEIKGMEHYFIQQFDY